MGRPKLTEGGRTKKIDVRFTQKEFELIERLEIQLGLSKTELIRWRTLNIEEKMLVDAKSLIWLLDHIGAEMNRIGNNINQLARHANTLDLQNALSPNVVIGFNELFREYLHLQQQLQASFRKLIRLTGR